MIINSESNTAFSGIYLRYNSGSLRETPGYFGISHLIEHLMCKGVDEMQDEMQTAGVAYNAYTSNNEVVYYANGLEEYLAPIRNRFINKIINFEFTKEQFENEKKIVLEEYDDAWTDQVYQHALNHDRKNYGMYNAIGYRKDIENISYEDCMNYAKTNFAAPNAIVSIAKGFELAGNFEFKDYQNTFKPVRRTRQDAVMEFGAEFKDKTSIIMESDIIDTVKPEIGFICSMLGSGLNSPLTQEVREKRGMTYSIDISAPIYNKSMIIGVSVSTNNSKVDECVKTINEVLQSPEKYMTEERFNVIKGAKTVAEKKERVLNHGMASFKLLSMPKEWNKKAEDMKYDEVMATYKQYFMKPFIVSTDKDFNA